MVKIHAGKMSPEELLAIKNSSEYRLGSTPLGQKEGRQQMYIGKAVPWKHVKFNNPDKTEKSIDQIANECGISTAAGKAKLETVVTNIRKLGKVSEDLKDVKGVGYTHVPGKGRIYITNHSRVLMKAAGKSIPPLESVKMPWKSVGIERYVSNVVDAKATA